MFESGAMKAITQLWHQELHSSSSPNAKFLSDYLLVLSSILRHFPLSQKVFFAARSDGKDPVGFALLDATIKSPVWLCRDVQCQKLKLRIFGLLGDLLDERASASCSISTTTSQFDLAAGIRRYGWCREVVALITDSALLTDHSSRERALRAGLQIAQVCSPQRLFGNETDSKSLSNVLDGWEKEYSELARREVTDVSVEEEHLRYFASLLELLYRFRAVVYGTEKTFHPLRSEL
ncbi:unnamed protein product [Dibothriocephalus latus]|uniref:Uncharacterized protein n=1 Tax=Dibothriocephalus latus TaxID=60516 RepID=A0A3P7N7I5_DIBLA|nr:unnamed protein product [Dibothriocephalus latus]